MSTPTLKTFYRVKFENITTLDEMKEFMSIVLQAMFEEDKRVTEFHIEQEDIDQTPLLKKIAEPIELEVTEEKEDENYSKSPILRMVDDFLGIPD